MTPDKNSAAGGHQGSNHPYHGSLDAADIGHQYPGTGGEGRYPGNHFGHIPCRHGEDDTVSPGDHFIHLGRGAVDESGRSEELGDGFGAARPGAQAHAGTFRPHCLQDRPPDETGAENRDVMKRLSLVRTQGTLK